MLGNGKLIDAVSMASDITSETLDLLIGMFEPKRFVALQFHAPNATHVGTVAVQGSNDGVNWNAIPLSSPPTAANGSAFDALVELPDVACHYLRAVYTASSGSGALTCIAVCK